jgi:hypothetical protein
MRDKGELLLRILQQLPMGVGGRASLMLENATIWYIQGEWYLMCGENEGIRVTSEPHIIYRGDTYSPRPTRMRLIVLDSVDLGIHAERRGRLGVYIVVHPESYSVRIRSFAPYTQ